MNTADIFLTAVGLAMDASAVSLAAAASGYAENARAAFRLSFHFGFFQFIMPVIGWFSGIALLSRFSFLNRWAAFLLLAFIGIRMIHSGFKSGTDTHKTDPSRGAALVMLSVATSIDALAVGASLAMLGVAILLPSVVIGVVTSASALAAIAAGKRLGTMFGNRMEIAGGLILIGIGIKILL